MNELSLNEWSSYSSLKRKKRRRSYSRSLNVIKSGRGVNALLDVSMSCWFGLKRLFDFRLFTLRISFEFLPSSLIFHVCVRTRTSFTSKANVYCDRKEIDSRLSQHSLHLLPEKQFPQFLLDGVLTTQKGSVELFSSRQACGPPSLYGKNIFMLKHFSSCRNFQFNNSQQFPPAHTYTYTHIIHTQINPLRPAYITRHSTFITRGTIRGDALILPSIYHHNAPITYRLIDLQGDTINERF